MKTLNEYINESLLDDLDKLEKDSDNGAKLSLIEKFLKENYYIRGNYTIKDGVVDVNGSVIAKNKNLTELTKGMFVFGSVKGDFYCANCVKLTSLKGVPKEVGRSFSCANCASLTSLKGAPEEVGENFDCSYCDSLTSLEGAPEEVAGNFSCSFCAKLTSLKGAPKEVHGWFGCKNCGGGSLKNR